jgi:hypothetical protein
MLNKKIKQSNKPNQTNDQAKEKKKKRSLLPIIKLYAATLYDHQ